MSGIKQPIIGYYVLLYLAVLLRH